MDLNDKSLMIIDDDDIFRNRLITAMKRKGYEAYGHHLFQKQNHWLTQTLQSTQLLIYDLMTEMVLRLFQFYQIKGQIVKS